ncbi:MAG: VWA domain-containing protein [Gemmataceae bacterium]|nr:VWA domain-containing protein [Gemmataceae bacterium]MCI0740942.1 VWA domain-containing protein [Gemmataceae bacterium]
MRSVPLRLRCALVCWAFCLFLIATTGCGCNKKRSEKPRNLSNIAFQAEADEDKATWQQEDPAGESYERIFDNAFLLAANHPLSTFSIDVDTASYSNVRRFLDIGRLPPKDAVRIEELVNYFRYEYSQPRGEHPLAVHSEVAKCPWNPQHQLVRIGLQGKHIDEEHMPPRNLVFLLDTSGSMNAPNRLPLLQQGLRLLVEKLNHRDRVAIVAYAGTAGLVLPSTPGQRKDLILSAIDRLHAGGSTNGGEGIVLAYRLAQDSFIPGGANRVILGTDGDFNVGVTSQGELVRLIEEKRKTGVYLSLLGFGMGNVKDGTLESLARHGNGQYAYIDSLAEARKVFVDDVANLVPIARDVKVQVEFNPAWVQAYRLIGYENRLLKDQDFNDDGKDAGDMGAGHAVTALYEIVPPGVKLHAAKIDPLRYQKTPAPTVNADTPELLTVKVRYIPPEGRVSSLLAQPLRNSMRSVTDASSDFRFSAAVAAFGMLLRDSPHKGNATFDMVRDLAGSAMEFDPNGSRAEFLRLVGTAQGLSKK